MTFTKKAEFLYDEHGKKTRVILDRKDFEALMDELETVKDLYTVQLRTRGKKIKLIPFDVVKKELGLDENKKSS